MGTPSTIRSELIQAQVELCASKKVPMFMPENGYCYSGHDIIGVRGERLRTEIVTGCPVCHRSFCD